MEDDERQQPKPYLRLIQPNKNLLTVLQLQETEKPVRIDTLYNTLSFSPAVGETNNEKITKKIKFYNINIATDIDKFINILFTTKIIYKLQLLYNLMEHKYNGIDVERIRSIEDGEPQYAQEQVFSARDDDYTLISYNYYIKTARNTYYLNDVNISNNLYTDSTGRYLYIIDRSHEKDYAKVFADTYGTVASFSVNDVEISRLLKGGYNKKHKVYYNAKTKKYYIDYNNKKINLTLNNIYKNKGKYYMKLKKETIEIYI